MLAPLLIRRVATSLLSFSAARWGVSVHQGLGFEIRDREELRFGTVFGWREDVGGRI